MPHCWISAETFYILAVSVHYSEKLGSFANKVKTMMPQKNCNKQDVMI